jgi:hypothetical protein
VQLGCVARVVNLFANISKLARKFISLSWAIPKRNFNLILLPLTIAHVDFARTAVNKTEGLFLAQHQDGVGRPKKPQQDKRSI